MKELKMIIKECDIESQVRIFGENISSYTVTDLNCRLNPETKILKIVLK